VTGTLINVGTVLAGGAIGTVLGQRFHTGTRSTLLQAIGLVTIVIGLQRVLPATDVLLLLVSVILGGLVGEALRIEDQLARLAALAERRFTRPKLPVSDSEAGPDPVGSADVSVARGFVTASLIFCVGPMTILGSFEDGLTGAFQTLALKATLDGITAAILAATLGWGVLLAAATVLFFQGALTLGAGVLRGALTDEMIMQMTAVGGLLIVGIGLNILEVARIRVGNLLPSLLTAPILVMLTGVRPWS
jgi:uncharacterized membrane protein YqgA involved in biofilm formation